MSMKHSKCAIFLIASAYLLLSVLSTSLLGQNQNNFWFFGGNAGLQFSGPQPNNISSPLDTKEGCAAISDQAGNLLFFTDGIFVYDRNLNQMPNGFDLFGDPSATSSAIIVPKPCSDPEEYYIFTVDKIDGDKDLNYTLVDMSLNGGLGDVVSSQKNVPLPGPNSEKICVLKKSNNFDFWVISTIKESNTFYVYEVTADGVNFDSTYEVGGITTANGYLKASPCGDKIAVANFVAGFYDPDVAVYDFNNLTGEISNPKNISEDLDRSYGIEFSPNCQFLYFTLIGYVNSLSDGKVYQVDITQPVLNKVEIASIPDVNETNESRYACGALQLTPDGKRILIAKDGEFELAAINNINMAHPACSVDQDAIQLNEVCYLGLPTFISGTITSECGSCDSNETEDLCGICDADPTNDNETCTDCFGVLFGTAEIDECGVCDGPGIPIGECDCIGTLAPPGFCDCDGNVVDECGDCGGLGIPGGDCDCDGNELDECGVCGGEGIPDGECDCSGSLIPPGDCDCIGNVLDDCGVCGGGGPPPGDCDCDGNKLDNCGVCGGPGKLPGACDCAGNFVDECGVCGGSGFPEGACDCQGNTEDCLCKGLDPSNRVENGRVGELYITDAFSPNADGVNDYVSIFSNEEIDFVNFEIYNRWGAKVYENLDFSLSGKMDLWDGQLDGGLAGVAVYVFSATIICKDGQEKIVRGHITSIGGN